LIQYQKSRTGGHDNEQNPNYENNRTIATRLRTLRTLRLKLGIEHLQELFWR